jgi:hypothetical protein
MVLLLPEATHHHFPSRRFGSGHWRPQRWAIQGPDDFMLEGGWRRPEGRSSLAALGRHNPA